jgi:RIO kinase 1
MSIDHLSLDALQSFVDEGWLNEVLYPVKSGKEATVLCCRGGPRAPIPLVAAKVHRALEDRSFRNDAVYLEGRLHMVREGRARRAVEKKTAFGRQVQYGTWIAEEWEVLNVLYDCGVPVPRPIAVGERAILMSFVGDDQGPAPMLHAHRPAHGEAAAIVDDLLHAIEHMLHLDCVHGDLSPHNVMVHGGKAVVIDFPQAVDPRGNHAARELLERDVARVCAWGERHGVRRPAERIVRRLWHRFVEGDVG